MADEVNLSHLFRNYFEFISFKIILITIRMQICAALNGLPARGGGYSIDWIFIAKIAFLRPPKLLKLEQVYMWKFWKKSFSQMTPLEPPDLSKKGAIFERKILRYSIVFVISINKMQFSPKY